MGDQLPRIQGDGGAGDAVERPVEVAGGYRGRRARAAASSRPNAPPSDALSRPFTTRPARHWRGGDDLIGDRAIPEETAVALTYNSVAHAVMMATPDDLEDFAVGFSLSEGIVARPRDIHDRDRPGDNGVELRMWLAEARGDAFTGTAPLPGGADRLRPVRHREPRPGDAAAAGGDSGLARRPWMIAAASPRSPPRRPEPRNTRGPCRGLLGAGSGLVALREDVGRHNALDKLAGALARGDVPAARGIVLLTSRVSVEMVQKAAVMGAPVIVAVSAPTALALRTAEAAGITRAAIARDDGFELFTHPRRIDLKVVEHVA